MMRPSLEAQYGDLNAFERLKMADDLPVLS